MAPAMVVNKDTHGRIRAEKAGERRYEAAEKKLTIAALGPIAKIPGYKVGTVRLEKAV